MTRFLPALCSLLLCLSAQARTLNVYNWSDFIPDSVLHQFETESGIKVNYSNYDSNEALYAKLKASRRQVYDVIFPSNYFVMRMIRQNMLERLDYKKFKNLSNMDPRFLNLSYDPKNRYSLPFLWSTTAIMVNKKYIDPKTITGWNDLWQPRFKNQLLLLDDTRDVFSMGFIAMGKSPNTKDPKIIEQNFTRLKALLPNVRLFNSIAMTNIFLDEDIHIGMVWSGEAAIAQRENPDLVYIYPKEGFTIGLDCMAITKNAPHLEEAYLFIDFLMRPDIAKKIIEFTNFMAPNTGAAKLLPKNLRENKIILPDAKTLKDGIYVEDIGQTAELLEHYWQRLKLS